MSLQGNLKALKTRCEFHIQQNDVRLSKQERQIRQLEEEIAEIESSLTSIKYVQKGLCAPGQFTQEKLFALQRTQAALRRKMAEMVLQRSQQMMEREKCEAEKKKVLVLRQQIMKKSEKYDVLRKKEMKKYRLATLLAEESEIEERTSCRP